MIPHLRLIIAVFVLGIFSYTTPADAQSNPDDLERVEKRLKDQAAEEKRLRREARERAKEIEALRHRMIETANAIQNAERQITDLEQSIDELETERSAAQSALEQQAEMVSALLGALQSLERARPPALLVSPDDANDAARAAMLLSDAAPEVEERAGRLRAALARLAALTNALNTEREQLTTTNRELGARRDVLQELLAQKEKERDVATRLASAAQKETARLALEATTLREVLQRLERVAHSVVPRLKPARIIRPTRTQPSPIVPTAPTAKPTLKPVQPLKFATARSFEAARGLLRPPAAGRLIGQFGKQRPDGGKYEGIRLRTRNNSIVTAPFEGRVVVAREWGPIGKLLILDVGEGYHILIMGVGALLVEENQQIAAGEPVAQMSASGLDLDLEIRKNGEPVNPSLWLANTN